MMLNPLVTSLTETLVALDKFIVRESGRRSVPSLQESPERADSNELGDEDKCPGEFECPQSPDAGPYAWERSNKMAFAMIFKVMFNKHLAHLPALTSITISGLFAGCASGEPTDGGLDPPPGGVASSCLRTLNVSTVSGLTSALSQAVPGDCILLAAGTYGLTTGTAENTVGLPITRSGTAAAPIILQGEGSSTTIDLNQRLMYVDASYFQLRRLRLTDFPGVGLWLRGVTGVVIDSVEVDHTLQEAVGLKYGSNHNIIKNSLFHDTGIRIQEYGEGIYIGFSGSAEFPLDFGVTDNQVLNNHFGPNVRAEAIDVKEGADRTLIRGNFIDGTGSVFIPGASTSLIQVLASGVTIDSNFMQYGKPMAVTFVRPQTVTMSGNIVTRNTIDLQDIHEAERGTLVPYGFQFQAGTVDPMGGVVNCNNVMVSGILSNRPCTP
jgi:hypothetical protein